MSTCIALPCLSLAVWTSYPTAKSLASLSLNYHDAFQECGKFTYVVHSRHLEHRNPRMRSVTVYCSKMVSSKVSITELQK